MKIFKLFLAILFFTLIANTKAQDWRSELYERIDSSYTIFSSHNNHKFTISFNFGDVREYHIKVHDSNGELMQTLSNINYTAERKGDFELEDINFDNYDDLLVLDNENPINKCYEFWRFDTIQQKYIYDSLYYSKVTCNPSFDENIKTIETGGHDGMSPTFWREVYSYNNGELILIEEESQQRYEVIDSTYNDYNYKRIKRMRQGDEMVTVKETIGTWEEIVKEWGD